MKPPILSLPLSRAAFIGSVAALFVFGSAVRAAEILPNETSRQSVDARPAVAVTPVQTGNVGALGLLGGAALLIAGGFRSRQRQKSGGARVPDFEGAFRRQNGDRIRVGRRPSPRPVLPRRKH